jgi:nitroimidazol reductase NimA-like FMN-containing flavoprotein (pyridoxamine 5'-phosphate oxidase superfamily)
VNDEPEDQAQLVELSEAECYELLGRAQVGRVATTAPGEPPVVVPVTFTLDGRIVVFRTAMGVKLEGIRSGPASFEVDSFDSLHRTGWSVLLRGVAYEATPKEVEHLDIEPWAPGERDIWVRLVPGAVTGRRIVSSGQGLDWRGYR